MIEFYNQ